MSEIKDLLVKEEKIFKLWQKSCCEERRRHEKDLRAVRKRIKELEFENQQSV